MKHRFEPIDGLWRFHLIYTIATFILGWSTFPHERYRSFLILTFLAFFGLIAIRLAWHYISHVIAFVLGIFSPVVIFTQLVWWQVVIAVGGLSLVVYVARRYLF